MYKYRIHKHQYNSLYSVKKNGSYQINEFFYLQIQETQASFKPSAQKQKLAAEVETAPLGLSH